MDVFGNLEEKFYGGRSKCEDNFLDVERFFYFICDCLVVGFGGGREVGLGY